MSNRPDPDHPQARNLSPAQQARLRLAKARLQEARDADHGSATAAELVFTVGRLASALEDMIDLLEA